MEAPPHYERQRLVEANTVITCTVSALNTDEFLRVRFNEARKHLSLGGRWVFRTVTFYFDGTTEAGARLWERQDRLMTGEISCGSVLGARTVENPARQMKGKKERNPLWGNLVPEWACFKAPKLRGHTFSPHNHNWTTFPLYGDAFAIVRADICWARDCRLCEVDCGIRQSASKQEGLEGEVRVDGLFHGN